MIEEFSHRTKVEDEDILLSAAIEGMFLNTELFGHQRGASNKGYKKINYGTLVLSTQNLHLGNANVNLRFEHGMVSPAYKTYSIEEIPFYNGENYVIINNNEPYFTENDLSIESFEIYSSNIKINSIYRKPKSACWKRTYDTY